MPKVVAINISTEKGVTKHSIEEGIFKENHGIEGDAHVGYWHRQVSLLAKIGICFLFSHTIS